MYKTGDEIGDWIVESSLGAGGMGSVYRCHNKFTERIKAAVKVIFSTGGTSEEARERFIREVEALESLQHTGIVRVKGWGETETGELWLAMDLVEGEDLEKRVARGAIPVDEIPKLFEGLVEGLAHAHERGVFHRDIKPANLLIDSNGCGRLVDFGIAVQDDRTRVTMANTIPGTPAYLAPEVFGGHPDPRGLDIYALGQVLYEALTGSAAFPDPGPLTMTQRIAHVAGLKLRTGKLDPGPDYPNYLRRLVISATHPDPKLRLTSLDDFASALKGTLLEEPAPAVATMAFDLTEVLDQVESDQISSDLPSPSEPIAAPQTAVLKTAEVSDDDAAVNDLLGPQKAPDLPVPHAPTLPNAPTPHPTGTNRGILMGAAATLGLGLLATLFVGFLSPAPRTVAIRLQNLPPGMEYQARIGNTWLKGAPPWSIDDVSGATTVSIVAGDDCKLDAFPDSCEANCFCQTLEVAAGESDVALEIAPVPELVGVKVHLWLTKPTDDGTIGKESIEKRGAKVVSYSAGHSFYRGKLYYWHASKKPAAEALVRALGHLGKVTPELRNTEPPDDFDMIVYVP